MSVAQAVAFVERIKERTGKYPGLYGSENRLRQMLYGRGATSAHRQILTNCWLWIANYHAEPRNTAPWSSWHMWQYCGDGKCDLRPRSMYPKSVANVRKAERNIFRGEQRHAASILARERVVSFAIRIVVADDSIFERQQSLLFQSD